MPRARLAGPQAVCLAVRSTCGGTACSTNTPLSVGAAALHHPSGMSAGSRHQRRSSVPEQLERLSACGATRAMLTHEDAPESPEPHALNPRRAGISNGDDAQLLSCRGASCRGHFRSPRSGLYVVLSGARPAARGVSSAAACAACVVGALRARRATRRRMHTVRSAARAARGV
jgi:hypothetical protein